MKLQRWVSGLHVTVGWIAVCALVFVGTAHSGYGVTDPCKYQEDQLRKADAQLRRAQQTLDSAQNRLERTQESGATAIDNAQNRVASAQSSAAMIIASANAYVCINFNIMGAIRCAVQMAARKRSAATRAASIIRSANQRLQFTIQNVNLRIQRDAARVTQAQTAYNQAKADDDAKALALAQCQSGQPHS